MRTFHARHKTEDPYALAIIAGQSGNYLGFAVATEQGLRKVATKYYAKGYRYKRFDWEEADQIEKISIWLRWANPDDGWHFGEFQKSAHITKALGDMFKAGTLSDDTLEAFCTDRVLGPMCRTRAWNQEPFAKNLVVGFTYGETPRDFLRSATRANSYPVVHGLWQAHWRAEEVERYIKKRD